MDVGPVKQVMMPAAWVSVISIVAWLVADVAGMANGGAGSGWAVLHHPWAVVVTAFLVGLAVVWAGAGRSARSLTIAALCVTVLFTIDAVVLGVVRIVGASSAGIPVAGEAIGWIGSLALSVMAIVALLRLLPFTAAHSDHKDAPAELPQDSRAPTWEVDLAAGAHWQTAGAAAAGAAAHDRGRPGERGGWTAAGDRSREAAPKALPGGAPPEATPRAGSTPAPIREPQAFGPDGRVTHRSESREGRRDRMAPDAGAPDDPGVSSGDGTAGEHPAGAMPPEQPPGPPDPRALAQQYAAPTGRGSPTGAPTIEDATGDAKSGTRHRPLWMPLDRDQPPGEKQ